MEEKNMMMKKEKLEERNRIGEEGDRVEEM